VVIKSKVEIFVQVYQNKKALELASNSKTNFLANMSHEIRTPLNSILGMAQVMSDGELTKDQQNYITIIQRAGKDLLSLINNILDLSKIEAGELKLDKEEFFIDDILNDCLDLLTINARKKGLELYCEIANRVPDYVIGDPTRLKQILINLISNAIKYTDKGHIKVTCSIKNQSKENFSSLIIEVIDTGRGIPEEKRRSLFKNYFQVNPLMDKNKGFGLGLAITKNLVDLMDGIIEIESEQNQGSNFRVSIPVEVTKKSLFNENFLDRKKILFINFVDKLSKISRSLFTDMGAKIFLLSKIDEAQQEIIQNEKDYDLIFYFWNYEKDSKESTKIINLLEKNKALKEKMLFLLDTNINYQKPPTKYYITTPLKRSELKKYANQIINLKDIPYEKPALSHHKKDLRDLKGKILLVDDSEDSRLLIKIFLKSSKIDLEIAENGIDGFKKFKENHYDIILMDVQMPEMDGLSCTKKIREFESEHPQKRKTYILAMTAYAFNEDIRKTKEAGCNDHISKPINKVRLIKSLKDYLKH